MQFQSESLSLRDVPVMNEGIREVSFRDQGVRVVLHYDYGAGYMRLHRENYEFVKFDYETRGALSFILQQGVHEV
jgi:hypothetical protein